MTYLGSKRLYAKYIVPILQDIIDKNQIKVFVDACCGGCNIIDKIKCDRRIAFDKNKYLIDLYKEVQKNSTKHFPQAITKEDWDFRRDNPDTNPLWLTALTAIFCSYYTRGFSGGYDKRRNQYQGRLSTFSKQIPLLKDIEFQVADINEFDINQSLMYVDPPYKNTKKYDFSKDFNYDQFWDSIRRLGKNNIVLVSEQQAPEDFKAIWEKDTTRDIQGKSYPATEKLFIAENIYL